MSEKGMSTIGMVVAIALAVIGLVVVGFFVLVAVSLNAWGSSK
ncbi:MAG: hypothetical protein ACR2G7_12215 [Acidimicrobiales bacterium]